MSLGVSLAQDHPIYEHVGEKFRSINDFENIEGYENWGGVMLTIDSAINIGYGHYRNELEHIMVFMTIETKEGRAEYSLIDALIISDIDSNQFVNYYTCRVDQIDDRFIVAVYEPKSWDEEFFTDITRAWTVNLLTKEFEIIDPKRVDCYNEGFGH